MVNLYTILWTSAPETILESETLDQACPPPPFIRQKSDILEVVWLMMPTVRGSGGSTMDWSCFAHSEPGQLDVINETMNFAVWLKSSRHHFVPSSSNALDSGFKSIWDVIVGLYAGNSRLKKNKKLQYDWVETNFLHHEAKKLNYFGQGWHDYFFFALAEITFWWFFFPPK